MATSQSTSKASQADDKTPEGEDKATSTAAPELREREKVAPEGSDSDSKADQRKAEALRVLGFPEREAKSVREDDGTVIVEHVHGAEYRVAEDGTVDSTPAGEEKAWPARPVTANGADVPPQAVQASSEAQDGGSDTLPVDIDPEDHARLSEIADPEEAAEAREQVLAHTSRRPAASDTDRSTDADTTPGGAATKGTTDAARARKS